MKFIEDLKNRLGSWQLGREMRTHKRRQKLVPFGQMVTVGMVYDANDDRNEQEVSAYANELRSQGKKVFMLGFVNEKDLPQTKKFVLNSEFFWKAKLNGFNLPIKGDIGQFLQLDFDLLLNLSLTPWLPIQAITVYSKANYKVGPIEKNGLNYFDFMVDLGPKQELPFLIEQMDFYLKQIK